MDHYFLNGVAESFLMNHDVYLNSSKKQITVIKDRVIQEILGLTKDLQENDIELYNQIYDRSKGYQNQVISDYLTYCFGDQETINEIGVFEIGLGLSLLVSMIYHKTITKSVMSVADKLGKGFEALGKKLVKMGRYKQFTKPNQLTRVIAAEKNKAGDWPEYVIVGWDGLLKELDRIIKLGGF